VNRLQFADGWPFGSLRGAAAPILPRDIPVNNHIAFLSPDNQHQHLLPTIRSQGSLLSEEDAGIGIGGSAPPPSLAREGARLKSIWYEDKGPGPDTLPHAETESLKTFQHVGGFRHNTTLASACEQWIGCQMARRVHYGEWQTRMYNASHSSYRYTYYIAVGRHLCGMA